MEDKQAMLAINVYLEPYFRKAIFEKIYSHKSELGESARSAFFASVKEEVRVSGFRTTLNAPLNLLVKASEARFEHSSKFVKATLEAWASLFITDLGQLKAMLEEIGFVCPDLQSAYQDPERAFSEGWPTDCGYASLESRYHQAYPNSPLNRDEIALLSVWLSACLPGTNAHEN